MSERQPAGQPTGGQFAPTSGSDAGVDLSVTNMGTEREAMLLSGMTGWVPGAQDSTDYQDALEHAAAAQVDGQIDDSAPGEVIILSVNGGTEPTDEEWARVERVVDQFLDEHDVEARNFPNPDRWHALSWYWTQGPTRYDLAWDPQHMSDLLDRYMSETSQ